MHRWRVEKREQLAKFLQAKLTISGKKIRKLLELNCCRVNGKVERFGSVYLEKGTVVEFTQTEEAPSHWKVLYENEDFQIVDKPAAWVCSESNCQKTFKGKLQLVHRLDKDTTGAFLLAKNAAARDELMALFKEKEIEKEYLAIVDGAPQKDQGVIDNYLAKKGSFQGQTIWGSSPKGDRAITHWKVLARGKDMALMSLKPITGRTHQIRVHMAEMGHPLLIDRQYAKHFRSKILAARPLLHAVRLRFVYHGAAIDVLCPPPKDFSNHFRQVDELLQNPGS